MPAIDRRSLIAALAATTAGIGRARAEADTLVVAQFSETRDLASIDAFRSLDFTIPNSLVFDRLIERDPVGRLAPGLATSWDRTGPLTWRLAIRQGVRFHDGSVLTAADAAATLTYALDPANRSGIRLQVAPLAKAEAPDAATLVLHTAIATSLLPDIVAAVPVLPAAQLAAADAPFRTRPIGSGPWRLADWRAGERLSVEATGEHWSLRAPAFRKIMIRVVPEASTRVADLLSGGAQIAADVPPALTGRLGRAGTRQVRQPGVRTNYLSFLFKPPFDDPRVRRAVYHAIDRRAYVDLVWGGLAEAATGAVRSGFGGHVPALPLSDHDPEKARALLRDAGHVAPVQVDLDAPPVELVAAQVLQAQMARAGFEVRINPVESPAALFDPKRLSAFDRGRMWMVTALDNHSLDAVRPYNAFYAANAFLKDAVGYTPDARLSAAASRYVSAPDAERAAASGAVMDLARADAPVVFLAFPDVAYGVASGVEMPQSSLGRLDFVSLRQR